MPAAFPILHTADTLSKGGASTIDAAEPVLARIRQLLDVKAVMLHRCVGDMLVLDGISGAASLAAEAMPLCRHALAAHQPFIVPDTALDTRFATLSHQFRFYAGMPLFGADNHPIGVLSLLDTAPRDAHDALRLALLTSEVTTEIARRHDARAIASLQAQLAAQSAALTHTRKIFERAAATAKIGVWECDLSDESLTWSDGVYDIFELPRGAAIDRRRTLRCYDPKSRAVLDALRSQAIRDRTGFTMDAEIITLKGRRRWIRLTATIESDQGVAVRILGMKQDITEEKILADRTRYLAEFDVMTGLANRSQFQSRLADCHGSNASIAPIGALLLVDLDGFKQINDTYGHALGDECLKETADRLRSVCQDVDLVARIGGDEFAVLVGPQFDDAAITALAKRIVAVLGLPVQFGGQSLKLGASVGIAHGTGLPPSDVFKQADTALYAAKAAGRNTFRMFTDA